MPLSEQECAEAYTWLIERLSTAEAEDVVREIEAIVRAGTTREEEGERRGSVTIRAALSPRERLIVALRLLLATASVPLMLESVARTIDRTTATFRWSADYLSGDEVSPPEMEAAFHQGDPGALRELEGAAREVLRLLTEVEAER